MKFYQLTYKRKPKPIGFINETAICPDGQESGSSQAEWFGTERDAVRRRGELYKAGALVGMKREAKIDPVEVPTDKAGLLRFLMANVPGEVIV